MAEHFLRRSEFAHYSFLPLRGLMLKLFLVGQFSLTFHISTLSSLFKQNGKSFARAVQLAADRVWGLFGERANLFVT